MSPVTGGHVQQTRRHPALALKVSQASTPLQLVAVWLCHLHYDFITPERRGRKGKKNSLHSSVNVHLKLQLNQSPARINRERLGRLEGGMEGRREEGSVWRCSLKIERNNWSIRKDGFCHFEKACQRVVHSHLPRAISSNSGLWMTRQSITSLWPNPSSPLPRSTTITLWV